MSTFYSLGVWGRELNTSFWCNMGKGIFQPVVLGFIIVWNYSVKLSYSLIFEYTGNLFYVLKLKSPHLVNNII